MTSFAQWEYKGMASEDIKVQGKLKTASAGRFFLIQKRPQPLATIALPLAMALP